MVVDTHAHVYKQYYLDINEIINNAKEKDVHKILNCGESLHSSKEVISLYKKYSDIFLCAVGIHPEHANEVNNDSIKKIELLLKKEGVVAIGEIGLEYHYNSDNKLIQKKLFVNQLDLAQKYNLPVIIHSREATEDMLKILKKYKLKGIIHCFSGSYEIAKEYIKMGYLLGIGGVVTFKNSKLIDTIKRIGPANIVFETDWPFLTPEPFRKYKNEPKYVVETIKFVSENLKIKYNDLILINNKNFNSTFNKSNL